MSSWSETKRTPEEDAANDARFPKRATSSKDNDPENKTGWVAYYAWGRGGSGDIAHWLYLPWAREDNNEEIREHIVHFHESWLEYAEQGYIEWHIGVTPPRSEVLKYANECMESSKRKLDIAIKLYNYVNDLDAKEYVP